MQFDRLIDALIEQESLKELVSYGCQASFVRYDEQSILETVSHYIQSGEFELPAAA